MILSDTTLSDELAVYPDTGDKMDIELRNYAGISQRR